MSVRKINESTLTAIGNAIRSKTGGSDLINPEDMATEIDGIPSGGGGILNLQEIASYTVENNIARFNLLIPTDYQNATVFVVALEGELQSADWVYVNPNASKQYKGGYFSNNSIKSYAHKIVFSKIGFLLPSNSLLCPYVGTVNLKLVTPPITNFLFSTYSSDNFFLPSFKATIYGG